MSIATDSKKLKILIKESLKEVISSEMMKLRASLLPYCSAGEQREIEKLYGKPQRKSARSFGVKL